MDSEFHRPSKVPGFELLGRKKKANDEHQKLWVPNLPSAGVVFPVSPNNLIPSMTGPSTWGFPGLEELRKAHFLGPGACRVLTLELTVEGI